MHKPMLDPKTKLSLPPQQQDKRSLVLVEQVDFDQWLAGTVEEAKALVQLTPVELFNAGPADQPAAAQEARLLL